MAISHAGANLTILQSSMIYAEFNVVGFFRRKTRFTWTGFFEGIENKEV